MKRIVSTAELWCWFLHLMLTKQRKKMTRQIYKTQLSVINSFNPLQKLRDFETDLTNPRLSSVNGADICEMG